MNEPIEEWSKEDLIKNVKMRCECIEQLQAENAEKDIQISQLKGLYKQNEQLLSDLVAASTLVASHINLSMSQAAEIELLKSLLNEAWPLITSYGTENCLSVRIEQALKGE